MLRFYKPYQRHSLETIPMPFHSNHPPKRMRWGSKFNNDTTSQSRPSRKLLAYKGRETVRFALNMPAYNTRNSRSRSPLLLILFFTWCHKFFLRHKCLPLPSEWSWSKHDLKQHTHKQRDKNKANASPKCTSTMHDAVFIRDCRRGNERKGKKASVFVCAVHMGRQCG